MMFGLLLPGLMFGNKRRYLLCFWIEFSKTYESNIGIPAGSMWIKTAGLKKGGEQKRKHLASKGFFLTLDFYLIDRFQTFPGKKFREEMFFFCSLIKYKTVLQKTSAQTTRSFFYLQILSSGICCLETGTGRRKCSRLRFENFRRRPVVRIFPGKFRSLQISGYRCRIHIMFAEIR